MCDAGPGPNQRNVPPVSKQSRGTGAGVGVSGWRGERRESVALGEEKLPFVGETERRENGGRTGGVNR